MEGNAPTVTIEVTQAKVCVCFQRNMALVVYRFCLSKTSNLIVSIVLN
jgi:hypothetical protein